jgi:hypothetical protein
MEEIIAFDLSRLREGEKYIGGDLSSTMFPIPRTAYFCQGFTAQIFKLMHYLGTRAALAISRHRSILL